MLTDADLSIRLTNFEDSFVERKTSGDTGDWISATVALANSTPIDYPSVLFIGVRDDGTIEPRQNLETLQKSYSKRVSENIYPLPPYFPKVFTSGGVSCLAVIIPGSPHRPHFAGLRFIRVRTKTYKASQADVERLVADRNPKAYEIRKYIRQVVFVDTIVRLPSKTGHLI
jgi:predicted HTH transcriptional regulator